MSIFYLLYVQIAMHRDVSDSRSMSCCGNTHVGAAMLGDWLTSNTSLSDLWYVFCPHDWSRAHDVLFSDQIFGSRGLSGEACEWVEVEHHADSSYVSKFVAFPALVCLFI